MAQIKVLRAVVETYLCMLRIIRSAVKQRATVWVTWFHRTNAVKLDAEIIRGLLGVNAKEFNSSRKVHFQITWIS